MKYNFILIKLKDKNNINKNLELFKLSFGKNRDNLYYNKNKKNIQIRI